MIEWSETKRKEEPGFFCSQAMAGARSPLVIVSDIRRKTDIEWFCGKFGDRIRRIRISADEGVRKARGWEFKDGIDNSSSECDLDDYLEWDLMIDNGDDSLTEIRVQELLEFVRKQQTS